MAHFLHLSEGRYINLDHILVVEEMREVTDFGKNKGWKSLFVRKNYTYEEGPIILRMDRSDTRYNDYPALLLFPHPHRKIIKRYFIPCI